MKTDIIKKYFSFLFLVSFLWLLFGLNEYSGFGMLVLPLLGFPYFVFIYFNKISELSSILKREYPEIFNINKMHYGYYKDELINATLLFGTEDFKNVQDKEVLELVRQTKLSIILALFSIVSPIFIILIIGVFR
jgi:hypothetical protein